MLPRCRVLLDRRSEPTADPVKTFRGPLAGEVGLIPLIMIGGEQCCGPRVGAGEATVDIDDRFLATITPSSAFEEYRLDIPTELAERRERSYAVLTLTTEPWRPSNFIPDSSDVRDLGVRVDWIEVR